MVTVVTGFFGGATHSMGAREALSTPRDQTFQALFCPYLPAYTICPSARSLAQALFASIPCSHPVWSDTGV